MDAPNRAAAIRLPTEPYPGLRPFLDHESALLLGRVRQVHEVIERLRETHFVAVIGGSGSGKSSLIRAGVVPELRGFGIAEAGDYWIPVVCTPGTTLPDAADSEAKPQTPITRLAWKFAQLLAPSDSVESDAKRRAEIAAVFRQEAGFARLIDAYSAALPRRGPSFERARFLFVIDQFEELFHPNNRDNADAKLLIEAVIDHFFNPHQRSYVVLTMRSEHLTDCAGYLELPDAINKSSYLVRRLDDSELKDAIIGPAKYYLRLLQRRGAPPGVTLPDDVVFDELVIKRLLTDVGRITGDADHLPLLQHLLARLWESACAREGLPFELVPAAITWPDLERAVAPHASRNEPGWLRGRTDINTLRRSLEMQAQALFDARTPAQQQMIDVVLRHLAFKDPNNGQYSQQRIDVDDPRLLPGIAEPRETLRELLDRGFLDTVNYLFWDKENPERVTLKVSHESFIRGWAHFRTLIDKEADRFDEFVSVLRKCEMWSDRPEYLLESSELARFEAFRLGLVFNDGTERADWFRVLRQYRDGERLLKMEERVDAFLTASRERVHAEEVAHEAAEQRQRESDEQVRLAEQRQREAEREQRRVEAEKQAAQSEQRASQAEADRAMALNRRNLATLMVVLIVLLFVLPWTAFIWGVETPVLHSADKFARARVLVDRRERSNTNPVSGAAGRELGSLLEAVKQVNEAKAEVTFFRDGWFQSLAHVLSPLREMRQLFMDSSSEPEVNGNLRRLVTTAVWRSDRSPPSVNAAAMFEPLRRDDVVCEIATKSGAKQRRQGSLFYDPDAARGAFFPKAESDETEIALYPATLKGDLCEVGPIAWSVPRYLEPLLLLDARVQYMAVAQTGQASGPVVQFYSIVWERGRDGRNLAATVRYRSVVTDGNAVELVRGAFDDPLPNAVNVGNVRSVPSWQEVGGTGVSVTGQSWRVFAEDARRIDPGGRDDWTALAQPTPDMACLRLAAGLAATKQPGFDQQMLQHGDHCFMVENGYPDQPVQSAANAAAILTRSIAPGTTRQQVRVYVYNQPSAEFAPIQDPKTLPVSIASFTAFESIDTDRLLHGEWVTATSGPYLGWIALRPQNASGSSGYLGVPWSTNALSRLASEVQKPSEVPLSAPVKAPQSASAPARSSPR